MQMANKHMKDVQHHMSCSTSYVLHIKTMRCYYTPIRIVKIWNSDNIKSWQGCGATGTLIHCCWICKTVQSLWKVVWQFLIKLNMLFLCDPVITCLVIYPNELESYICRKTWPWVLIEAILIIDKTWKHQDVLQKVNGSINCGTSI